MREIPACPLLDHFFDEGRIPIVVDPGANRDAPVRGSFRRTISIGWIERDLLREQSSSNRARRRGDAAHRGAKFLRDSFRTGNGAFLQSLAQWGWRSIIVRAHKGDSLP